MMKVVQLEVAALRAVTFLLFFFKRIFLVICLLYFVVAV